MNEVSSIAQTITAWLGADWKSFLIILAVAMAALWVWVRTGSTHVFTMFLLRWMMGRRKPGVTPLAKYLEERGELMDFRAATGLTRTPTIAVGSRVVRWAEANELNMDTVSAAGRFVDLRLPGLRGDAPASWKVLVPRFFAIQLAVLALAVGPVGFLAPPVVRVIDSDTWYVVDEDRIKQFDVWASGKRPRFYQPECVDAFKISQRTGYSASDVEVLCNVINSSHGKKELHDARVGQRIVVAFVTVLAGILIWTLFVMQRTAGAARQLHEDIVAYRAREAKDEPART